MPERIQLSRKKGWRLPEGAVSVARPGRWGNPFRVDLLGRERAVSAFRDLMDGLFSGPSFADLTDAQFTAMFDQIAAFQKRHGAERRQRADWELRGKNLACWCALPAPGEPDHCHASILLALANAPEIANAD